MTPDKIVVIIIGLLGIGFVYWFFLMRKGGPVPEDHSKHDISHADHNTHHHG